MDDISGCYDKLADRSNVEEELIWFCGLNAKQPIMAEKQIGGPWYGWSHCVSSEDAERERDGCWCSAPFAFLFSLVAQPMERCCSHSGCLPFSHTSLWKHLWRHTQKLTMEVNRKSSHILFSFNASCLSASAVINDFMINSIWDYKRYRKNVILKVNLNNLLQCIISKDSMVLVSWYA